MELSWLLQACPKPQKQQHDEQYDDNGLNHIAYEIIHFCIDIDILGSNLFYLHAEGKGGIVHQNKKIPTPTTQYPLLFLFYGQKIP